MWKSTCCFSSFPLMDTWAMNRVWICLCHALFSFCWGETVFQRDCAFLFTYVPAVHKGLGKQFLQYLFNSELLISSSARLKEEHKCYFIELEGFRKSFMAVWPSGISWKDSKRSWMSEWTILSPLAWCRLHLLLLPCDIDHHKCLIRNRVSL